MTDLFDDIFFEGIKKNVLGKRRQDTSDPQWLRNPERPQEKLQIRNLIHLDESKKID